MFRAWDILRDMSKMIQIRNVPDSTHLEVKTRAARAGMSLSDYLLREIERLVEAPPIEEFLDRWGKQVRIRVSESPAEVIRAELNSS